MNLPQVDYLEELPEDLASQLASSRKPELLYASHFKEKVEHEFDLYFCGFKAEQKNRHPGYNLIFKCRLVHTDHPNAADDPSKWVDLAFSATAFKVACDKARIDLLVERRLQNVFRVKFVHYGTHCKLTIIRSKSQLIDSSVKKQLNEGVI